MKRLFCLLIAALLAASMLAAGCACAESGNSDSIQVLGVFYGDFWQPLVKDPNDHEFAGYTGCLVVFDYVCGDSEKTLSGNSQDNTLTINGNAHVAQSLPSSGSFYLSRYTGYRRALLDDTLPAGSEPVRMFLFFLAEPDEFPSDATATLNVNGTTAEVDLSGATIIAAADEMLRVEGDNYAAKQADASFLWRVDHAFYNWDFAALVANAPFGDDFDALAETITYSFKEDVEWGVSAASDSAVTFTSKNQPNYPGFYFVPEAMSYALPSFDLEAVIAAHPEAADAIRAYVDLCNQFASAITNRKTSTKTVEELSEQILVQYYLICDAFGIPGYPELWADADADWAAITPERCALSSKPVVKMVQQALNDHGFDCGTPDGAAGKNTRNAIMDYQRANNMTPNGEISLALVLSLCGN